jgi:hypothetical protein
MTVEFGLDLLHQYFEDIKKGRKNHIDTLLISKFSGDIQKKYIGPRLHVPIENYYNLTWRS